VVFNVLLLRDSAPDVSDKKSVMNSAGQAVPDKSRVAINRNKKTESVGKIATEAELKHALNSNIKSTRSKQTKRRFINWASNKVIEYPYDELALNDKRLPKIEELINKAVEAKFKGRIILQTHAGLFCLNIDQMGNYKLADKNLSIANCQFIGNYIQPDDESTSHQSLSFVNFLSDTELLNSRGIAIEVMSLTRKLELSKYPRRVPQTTVDKWNQAAQLNNRITVMLEPDFADL